MGLLNGGAASIFGTIMGSYFLPATLHKSGILDYSSGVITSSGSTDMTCKAQVDVANRSMQSNANYVDGDVRIFVLTEKVTTDDEISVSRQRYKIYATMRDPANAYWDCSARHG